MRRRGSYLGIDALLFCEDARPKFGRIAHFWRQSLAVILGYKRSLYPLDVALGLIIPAVDEEEQTMKSLYLLFAGCMAVACSPADESSVDSLEPLDSEAALLEAQHHPHGNHGGTPASADVVELSHKVHVYGGAKLNVVERYVPNAHGRRAILMLPATLVTSTIWNAHVPGAESDYNALDRAARQGYRAYSLDREGYGQSSQPADGADVTPARMLKQMGDVIEWIRNRDHV